MKSVQRSDASPVITLTVPVLLPPVTDQKLPLALAQNAHSAVNTRRPECCSQTRAAELKTARRPGQLADALSTRAPGLGAAVQTGVGHWPGYGAFQCRGRRYDLLDAAGQKVKPAYHWRISASP